MLRAHLRSANRSLAQTLRPGQKLDFFCECDEAACKERVPLTRAQYNELHAGAAGFLVAPRHVNGHEDDVAVRTDGYVLLRDVQT